MCGICGEARFDGNTPDLSALERMMAALARRGPDHGGSFSDGGLALGHRRLAIIDLSENSDQPMIDSDLKLSIVFNGTIYNYRQLRAELVGLGYRFCSSGDTEVILKAYHAWGESCVTRLNGMFAFAVWDGHRRRLFLARDRSGIKPLYYTLDDQRLRFASSTQALLAAGGVDTGLDAIALHHHLTLHAVVPAPRTLLRGIRKLAPGHTLTIDLAADAWPGSRIRERRYWHAEAVRPPQPRSDSEWVEATRQALVQAVMLQHEAADVPVGVLLSGGLDSSLLVGLLASLGRRQIATFSVGFEDAGGERGAEFEFSDLVARAFGTRHHRYSISNLELLTRLPEAVRNMAEPMVGQDAVAFYLLAERVVRETKVVLSGQGADEVFAGYFWYPQMAAESGTPLERFRGHYFDRSHDEFLQTVQEPYHVEDVTSALVDARLHEPGADTFLDAVLRLDVTTLIVDDPVKRVDNMTMAWGLEARVPFLDHELVQLALCMPPALKLQHGGKYPLKAIARGLLPDAIIDRPKGYFPVPALKYVHGAVLEFIHDVLGSHACRTRGLFLKRYVDMLLAQPSAFFTPLAGNKLWHLALLEQWLQLNVDGVAHA